MTEGHRAARTHTHRTAGMRRFIAEHDWLTVYHLPPYIPQLNPVEGIWSLVRRGPLADHEITSST
ncbi:transposase [Actinocrinis puniceicyclus]|uniref:Transposase n=1 Tax=Actinocrinis puniceicyclus TaxID=977794 RepID=A0A8J7WL19_9ACTN|nr:transposase [Actinocrinis puniceicyclus]MBS2961455.1 transposase [Actinocrinis puniceicyclus]